jgi:hypothetical protein
MTSISPKSSINNTQTCPTNEDVSPAISQELLKPELKVKENSNVILLENATKYRIVRVTKKG